MFEARNQLKESYSTYQLRQITKLCHQIPKERREDLIIKLQAQQLLNSNGNKKLLNQALNLLKED